MLRCMKNENWRVGDWRGAVAVSGIWELDHAGGSWVDSGQCDRSVGSDWRAGGRKRNRSAQSVGDIRLRHRLYRLWQHFYRD